MLGYVFTVAVVVVLTTIVLVAAFVYHTFYTPYCAILQEHPEVILGVVSTRNDEYRFCGSDELPSCGIRQPAGVMIQWVRPFSALSGFPKPIHR
jgi:hypothetical protein